MVTECHRDTPEKIAEECEQWDEANQSRLVQHRQVRVVGAWVVVPDFKGEWNAKAFSGGRVFLEGPPSLFPSQHSKLPSGVLAGV